VQGGIDAVIDIRRQWPDHRTKIIAVTADAFEDTRDRCIANGFTGWLAKPFRGKRRGGEGQGLLLCLFKVWAMHAWQAIAILC